MYTHRWENAIGHARYMLEVYKGLGPVGIFGAAVLTKIIAQYEAGYRSEALLEALENIE
jgi:hypothetical protein